MNTCDYTRISNNRNVLTIIAPPHLPNDTPDSIFQLTLQDSTLFSFDNQCDGLCAAYACAYLDLTTTSQSYRIWTMRDIVSKVFSLFHRIPTFYALLRIVLSPQTF